MVMQILACFIGTTCFFTLTILACEKHRDLYTPRALIYCQSFNDRDQQHALENLGEDSVYRSFVGTSKWGWFLVLSTIVIQISILSIFACGSKRDLSDAKVDVVYTWQCTHDQEMCFDTSELDWKGWFAFVILMVAHLLKDGINGLKMIKHSIKQRHGDYI